MQYVSIPYSINEMDVSPHLYNTSIAMYTDDCPFGAIDLPVFAILS